MKCLICHQEIIPEVTWSTFWKPPEQETVCQQCAGQLEKINHPGCPVCYRVDSSGTCEDCARWKETQPAILEKNISVYRYNSFHKDLVARWKYRGDYVLLHAFMKDIQQKWKTSGLQGLPLVSVPLSKERERERGFNQSQAIIQGLGGKPLQLFERIHTEKQSKKGRKERMQADNPFTLIRSTTAPVVIVDDIYTTGSTVRHMASLLRQRGCPTVYSFTIFR